MKRHGEEIQIITSARSFLHHQVRIMVGTLAMVGKGKWHARRMSKQSARKPKTATEPRPALPPRRMDCI